MTKEEILKFEQATNGLSITLINVETLLIASLRRNACTCGRIRANSILQHYNKGVAFLGVVIYLYHTVIGRRIMKNYYAAGAEKKHSTTACSCTTIRLS